jgi:hypothetical protein
MLFYVSYTITIMGCLVFSQNDNGFKRAQVFLNEAIDLAKYLIKKAFPDKKKIKQTHSPPLSRVAMVKRSRTRPNINLKSVR